MNAAQIFMMPLAGAAPADTSTNAASAANAAPLAGDPFSQVLSDLLDGNGVLSDPASESSTEASEHGTASWAELPATPSPDPALQQIVAATAGAVAVAAPQQTVQQTVVETAVGELQQQQAVPVQSTVPVMVSVNETAEHVETFASPKIEVSEATMSNRAVVGADATVRREAAVVAAQAAPVATAVQPQAAVVHDATVRTDGPVVAAQAAPVATAVQPQAAVAHDATVRAEVPVVAAQAAPAVSAVQPQAAAAHDVTVRAEVPVVAAQAAPAVSAVQPQAAAAHDATVRAEVPVVSAQAAPAVSAVQPQAAVAHEVTVRPEAPAVAPQDAAPLNRPHANASAEWWSYERLGKPVASPVEGGAQNRPAIAEEPVGNLLAVAGVKSPSEQPEPATATVTELTVEAPLQGRTPADGTGMQHPALSSTTATRSETVAHAERTAESNRPALSEQVTRQVAERLGSHDFKQGKERISLTLNPENLGKIQMNFQMDQQNLRIEIVAENRTVRDALVQQADLVKESLARQNITVEKFDIATSGERAFQQQYQQSPQQRGLYGSLYERQGGGRGVTAGASGGTDDYQVPDGLQYFEQQYESTFAYRA
ncbi:flagellar hook-length control protein FliK [Trichlorobacter ammonificans]|uniref:Flagellar hook-length control protein fliK n=1 Tax=Trichlorobacter ammonificans TaxID=2916410 RepID=A0ABM9D430_9BACT|nr:flagellar hook-length control protein FliK [Trichlorobacter ammonificans]CAH2029992.1 Flagellar hook-length control protein fliK [Trichlorobacter ammonificans]